MAVILGLRFCLLILVVVGAEGNCAGLRTLVLDGGGVKGAVYGGASVAFEEAGVEFEAYAGTSAGSTGATLLAAGFTSCEVRDQLVGTDFKDLVDFSLPRAIRNAFVGRNGGILALWRLFSEGKGFFHGDGLESAVDAALAQKRCSMHMNITMQAAAENDGTY